MPNQVLNQNNSRKKIILLATISLLVIFPILVLYISSSGLKYNKSLKAEMIAYKDSVIVPESNFISLKTAVNKYNQEIDKITVISFYDSKCKDCDSNFKEIKRIQQEFLKKTKRVHIKTFCINADSLIDIYSFVAKEKIDTTNWNFYTSSIDEMSSFVKKLKLDINDCNNILILANRKDVIVNYYNVNKINEVNSLMKHATILLPAKEDRRKIKFKREKDIYQ